MKHRIILAILLCIGFIAAAQNRIDNQGRRQGHWIKTDKDGSRIFEGDFKDGKETGVFNYYYPDGTLKIRNTFTVPGKYCRHEAFDQKGHLLATGYYDQKNRDGEWRYYSEDGRLVKIASFRMGIKEGVHIVFDAKGDTSEVATWKNNHRHGRWGKRVGKGGWITGTYVEGLMQGLLVEHDANGRLVREGHYKDGQKDGSYRYYEQGVCTIDETWSKGTLSDRRILLHAPSEQWVSIFNIAYFMPKGSTATSTLVYLNDGRKLTCSDSFDDVNGRVGHDIFVIVDRKASLLANPSNIIGTEKDADGRETLILTPKPAFTIYPDEECAKMLRSLQRKDQLDER